MSVIIVGGGMAGATLALAISHLTSGQLPVHLVEATAPGASDHPGFDARAIALAAGTCQQLARVGIWQAIASCATPISTVHVSDRGHAGFVTWMRRRIVLMRSVRWLSCMMSGSGCLACCKKPRALPCIARRAFASLPVMPGRSA